MLPRQAEIRIPLPSVGARRLGLEPVHKGKREEPRQAVILRCVRAIKEIAEEEIVLRPVDERHVIRLASVGEIRGIDDPAVLEERKQLVSLFVRFALEHTETLCPSRGGIGTEHGKHGIVIIRHPEAAELVVAVGLGDHEIAGPAVLDRRGVSNRLHIGRVGKFRCVGLPRFRPALRAGAVFRPAKGDQLAGIRSVKEHLPRDREPLAVLFAGDGTDSVAAHFGRKIPHAGEYRKGAVCLVGRKHFL